MQQFKMTPVFAYMRGQITAAKGLSNLLKNDPIMVRAVGVDNCTFANLQRSFSKGWNDAKVVSGEMRAAPSHQS